jgi:hypothetical protein
LLACVDSLSGPISFALWRHDNSIILLLLPGNFGLSFVPCLADVFICGRLDIQTPHLLQPIITFPLHSVQNLVLQLVQHLPLQSRDPTKKSTCPRQRISDVFVIGAPDSWENSTQQRAGQLVQSNILPFPWVYNLWPTAVFFDSRTQICNISVEYLGRSSGQVNTNFTICNEIKTQR